MDWLSISNGFMHDAVVIHTDTTDERFFSKSLDSTDAADFTGDDTMPFRDCGVGVNRVWGGGVMMWLRQEAREEPVSGRSVKPFAHAPPSSLEKSPSAAEADHRI
jgi:hypothetical protein